MLKTTRLLPIDLYRKNMTKAPGMFIVNSESRVARGHHWFVAVHSFVPGSKKLFFDSTGNSPKHYGLQNSDYKFMRTRLQSKRSPLCWLYCIYVLYKLYHGMSIHIATKMFSKNVKQNDMLLLSKIKQLVAYI